MPDKKGFTEQEIWLLFTRNERGDVIASQRGLAGVDLPLSLDDAAFIIAMLESYRSLGENQISHMRRKAFKSITAKRDEIPRQSKPKAGYVYLIQCESLYKIGVAANVKARFSTMQSGSSKSLTLICAIKTNSMIDLEDKLHERFSDKRVRGEWFRLSIDDIEAIKAMAQ